jgi:hypothetical protein
MTNPSHPSDSSAKETASPPEKTTPELITSGLVKLGNREAINDYYIDKDVSSEPRKFAFKIYARLNAKKIKFSKISFQHSVFDGCYFNACVFDSCDFTGSRFIGCNLHKSKFFGCTFDYVTFERCQVDDEILASEAPLKENLRMRFARTLRMNYQQIGDAKAVNEAISLELEATAVYLYKSWKSKETYYKKHYAGWKRVRQFFRWTEFWALNFTWGNGESILKLLRTIIICIAGIAVYDIAITPQSTDIVKYLGKLGDALATFLGVARPPHFSNIALSIVTAIRFIVIALLTALLVKRFSRR